MLLVRSEHLAQSKRRALVHLDNPAPTDWQKRVANLTLFEELMEHPDFSYEMLARDYRLAQEAGKLQTADQVREFINSYDPPHPDLV